MGLPLNEGERIAGIMDEKSFNVVEIREYNQFQAKS